MTATGSSVLLVVCMRLLQERRQISGPPVDGGLDIVLFRLNPCYFFTIKNVNLREFALYTRSLSTGVPELLKFSNLRFSVFVPASDSRMAKGNSVEHWSLWRELVWFQ